MPPTKRKRRTKHRGNAAGSIEARGRTSRSQKLSPAEQKKADRATAREARMNKPPTWNGALFKAALGTDLPDLRFFRPVDMVVIVLFGTLIGLLGSLLSVGRHLKAV